MRIESNRLLVRQLKAADLNASLTHRLEPEIFKYIGEPPTESQIKQGFNQAVLPWQAQDDEKLGIAIVLKSDNIFTGELMFKYIDKEQGLAEIGYSLSSKYQGVGIAKEATSLLIDYAFKTLKLNKIIAHCDLRNTASFGLMEKLGMKREAHLVAHTKIAGISCDSYRYALIRKQWRNRFGLLPSKEGVNKR